MVLKYADDVYYGDHKLKKIYLGKDLVYSYIVSSPIVAKDDMSGSSEAQSYEEGSTSWGDLTLSSGCSVSKDGVEIQNEETYVSTAVSGISYPMTFEFKGRLDSSCYRAQDSGPGMLFGMSPTQNNWGSGVTCYATSDYGIIIDTTSAMKIVTNKYPSYVHIVLTIDSSGNLTLYLNGIANKWTATHDNATKSNKIYIYNGEGVGRFIGAISVMRWWSIALSESEITELFSMDSSDYTL